MDGWSADVDETKKLLTMDDHDDAAAARPQDGQPNTGDHDSGDLGPGVASGGDGPVPVRPVFLGNLIMGFKSEEVIEIFSRPIVPSEVPEGTFKPVAVDRVDLKRGYCFVFLKDVASIEEKDQVERFVESISGMAVPNVSSGLRVEFARGDGKVKRKEDERRKEIRPSETLFVVNFHEETTKKADLEMLFSPFGDLVRIDMKGNYAFVQFRTVEEAMRAKEATNGGKLDRSVLTVEYVARQRSDGGSRRGGWRGGDSRRYDDRRGPPRGPRSNTSGGGGYDRSRGDTRDRDRLDSRRDDRYDDTRYRDRSPPTTYRRRSRSRSYSPPRYRSRSPPRGRYDDRGGRYDAGRGSSPPPPLAPPAPPSYGRGRGPSPGSSYRDRGSRDREDRDLYSRGGDRDRGYHRP